MSTFFLGKVGLLLALITPLARSDEDDRPAPDLELLVDASEWASDGASTRAGDAGVELVITVGGSTLPSNLNRTAGPERTPGAGHATQHDL